MHRAPEVGKLVSLAAVNSAVSAVIGHHGSVVKGISESTGCRVCVERPVDGSGERVIRITGPKAEAVFQAFSAVLERVLQDPNPNRTVSYLAQSLRAPQQFVSTPYATLVPAFPTFADYYGYSMAYAKPAGEQAWANMWYPGKTNSNPAAEAAARHPEVLSNHVEMTALCSSEKWVWIIGKGGKIVREICATTGARVQLKPDPENDQQIRVRISGQLASVHAAHMRVIQRIMACEADPKIKESEGVGP